MAAISADVQLLDGIVVVTVSIPGAVSAAHIEIELLDHRTLEITAELGQIAVQLPAAIDEEDLVCKFDVATHVLTMQAPRLPTLSPTSAMWDSVWAGDSSANIPFVCDQLEVCCTTELNACHTAHAEKPFLQGGNPRGSRAMCAGEKGLHGDCSRGATARRESTCNCTTAGGDQGCSHCCVIKQVIPTLAS